MKCYFPEILSIKFSWIAISFSTFIASPSVATGDSSNSAMNLASIVAAAVNKDNLEFFQVIKIIYNSTIFPNIC